VNGQRKAGATAPAPLVLIGAMGSGKSTVGAVVARRTGRPFVDLDAQVAARAEVSIPEIFARWGEDHFRRLEAEALAEVLSGGDAPVVATGGGVVMTPANRDLLGGSPTVVWLRAGLDTLVQRLGEGAGRPLLAGDPAAALPGLLEQRGPVYAELADVVVDVDDLDAVQVATAVIEAADAGPPP
jgi:shikimate kinase